MPSLAQRLLDHLETVSGDRPDLVDETNDSLPLFLRQRYQIRSGHFFGSHYLLALEQDHWEAGSPGEYESHVEALRQHLQQSVVLVLPTLPSYARNRMVRMGLPFIVPGSQLFLPRVMMDLRERFPQPRPERGKPLTPAAQCLILYHLQRHSLEELPLRLIAEKIGYSPIMLTKVNRELEAAALCETARQGRALSLSFKLNGRALWEQAQPHLSSPVKKTHWLRWENAGYPALAAGLTALSQRTDISDDRLPTFALPGNTFQANLERGIFHRCHGPEDANLRLEAWSYNPLLLGSGTSVDPLSLYLSLRDSPDDRVQQQLAKLIDQVKW